MTTPASLGSVDVATIEKPKASEQMSNPNQDYYIADLRAQLVEFKHDKKELEKELKEVTKQRDALQVQVNTSEKNKEFELKQLAAEMNVERGKTLAGTLEGLGGAEGIQSLLGNIPEIIKALRPEVPAAPVITASVNNLPLDGLEPQRSAFMKNLFSFIKVMQPDEYNQFLKVCDALVSDREYLNDAHQALQGSLDPEAEQ